MIEEEREVRRQRPESFLGSQTKEDSKVCKRLLPSLHTKTKTKIKTKNGEQRLASVILILEYVLIQEN